MSNATPWWDIELESKPDFNQAMKRIYAWYEQEIIESHIIKQRAYRITGHGVSALNRAKRFYSGKTRQLTIRPAFA